MHCHFQYWIMHKLPRIKMLHVGTWKTPLLPRWSARRSSHERISWRSRWLQPRLLCTFPLESSGELRAITVVQKHNQNLKIGAWDETNVREAFLNSCVCFHNSTSQIYLCRLHVLLLNKLEILSLSRFCFWTVIRCASQKNHAANSAMCNDGPAGRAVRPTLGFLVATWHKQENV